MNANRATLGSTDSEIRATLTELLTALDPDAQYELRYEDFIADMPSPASGSAAATPCASCNAPSLLTPSPRSPCDGLAVPAISGQQWRAHLVEPQGDATP